MGKRKIQQSKKNKALRKQKNIARQEARLARKRLQEEIEQIHPKSSPEEDFCKPNEPPKKEVITQSESVSEWITSNLSIVENSLSTKRYHVYSIRTSEEVIGYLGVFRNGCFNYSIITDDIPSEQVLALIKKYIRKTLYLNPVENPKLYHPKDT